MNVDIKELVHAELEAIKNSIVMLEVDLEGKVKNRILVLKKDIQHFKNLGYAENLKKEYDPQIGHFVDFKHLDFKKETKQLIHNALIIEMNLFQKIKFYIKQLLGMSYGRK